ncbi:MAG: DNA translocase FtsK [Elusimicrobia bacterium]|nr:DNA translocase FtsK [Elusimicrobiota bacterium]
MPRFVKQRFASRESKKSGLRYAVYWMFSFAAALWLAWIIYMPSPEGIIGEKLSGVFRSFLGHSAYLFPILFLYGLIAILSKLNKPHKGIFTLISGIALILGAVSCALNLAHNHSSPSLFDGGWLGFAINEMFSKMFGDIGVMLLSAVMLIAGLQILFKISWTKSIKKWSAALISDYRYWTAARKELHNKLKIFSQKKEGNYPFISPIPDGAETPDIKIVRRRNTDSSAITPLAEQTETTSSESRQNPETPSLENKSANTEMAEDKNQEQPKDGSRKPVSPFKDFKLPTVDLLEKPSAKNLSVGPADEELTASKIKLEETFRSFNISAFVCGVYPGPVITRYEVTPSPGVKISSIVSLANDVALAMKAQGIRVIPQIPGKSAIGFEIPNNTRAKVVMRELLESSEFNERTEPLLFALGLHSEGSPAVADLETMPHLLVAGATNSGKSVFLHSLILSVMYRNTPEEVKFLFIDPKRLELTFYEDIPYLYDPNTTADKVKIITNPKEASKSLAALLKVMERRYIKFEKARVKNIASYNKWAVKNGEAPEFYIIVVIDELADLILQTKNVVEDAIQRLSQMARAVGIHLILATQRPSVDILTGVIKANLPTRVALQVTSKTDSRVIIDSPGAEALIGKGDLLYLASDAQKALRIQGAYVSENDIIKVADFLKAQAMPYYVAATEEEEKTFGGTGGSSQEIVGALKLVLERRRVSQDLLKAHFGSSARATNLLSILEMNGFIHKPEGSNRWEIYFDKIEDHLSKMGSAFSPVSKEIT